MPIDLLTLSAALLTGLMGGVHCIAMCGGIATGLASQSTRGGLRTAVALNGGRVLGYVLAGAIVGGFGGGLLALARSVGLAASLRVAMGAVLLLIALRLLWPHRFGAFGKIGALIWRRLQPIQQRVLPAASSAWRPWVQGIFWGWLLFGERTSAGTVCFRDLMASLSRSPIGSSTIITETQCWRCLADRLDGPARNRVRSNRLWACRHDASTTVTPQPYVTESLTMSDSKSAAWRQRSSYWNFSFRVGLGPCLLSDASPQAPAQLCASLRVEPSV